MVVNEGITELVILQRALKETALADPVFFLKKCVVTMDEHDHEHPYKPLPDKEYLWQIARAWSQNNMILVAKSRQMMLTWVMVALHVWLVLHEAKRVFFISKKETDADALKERAVFIMEHLPEWIRPKIRSKYCLLEVPAVNSQIVAVSQESDALRQYTASAILFDEMAFSDRAREIYLAAKPTVVGGGKFTGISSPNGKNFFYELCFDLAGL